MQVKLRLATPEIEISECAKICYGTKSMKDGGKDITYSLVHSKGHLAALRFAYATVEVEGISVACQNQVVRSKHLDFMVQSKRYVNANKGEFKFINPETPFDHSNYLMDKHFEESIILYNELISSGVKKEDARAILPANTSTKMIITGNIQAFDSFFKLRLNSHAQTEIRNLANKIYDILAIEYPQVFTKEYRELLSK